MNKPKLLIAEGAENVRLALADLLRGAFQVKVCADGNEARKLLRQFRPEILVLDLMLPGYDGISLLQWAVSVDIRPMVLATTRFSNDYVVDAAARLGVGYLMMKPCDLSATVERIRDLSQRLCPPQVAAPDPETRASNLLLALGVPTKLRGYGQLRTAVVLMARNPSQSVTKVLYPEVAKHCGCESMHVERSIRSAIAAAWEKRDDNIWKLYFRPDDSGQIPRPTNAAFISRLADSLRNQPPSA